MADDHVEINGVDEIIKRLRALPDEMQKGPNSPIRFGSLKAANLIRDRVMQLAPSEDGEYKRKIKVNFVRKGVESKTVRYRVYPGDRAKARWLERGTGAWFAGSPNHITPRKRDYLVDIYEGIIFGTSTVGQAPQPHWRPASEQSFRPAIDEFSRQAAAKLERLVRKLEKMK